MDCRCKAKGFIYKTIKYSGSTVKRYYRCIKCGYRWTTYEGFAAPVKGHILVHEDSQPFKVRPSHAGKSASSEP